MLLIRHGAVISDRLPSRPPAIQAGEFRPNAKDRSDDGAALKIPARAVMYLCLVLGALGVIYEIHAGWQPPFIPNWRNEAAFVVTIACTGVIALANYGMVALTAWQKLPRLIRPTPVYFAILFPIFFIIFYNDAELHEGIFNILAYSVISFLIVLAISTIISIISNLQWDFFAEELRDQEYFDPNYVVRKREKEAAYEAKIANPHKIIATLIIMILVLAVLTLLTPHLPETLFSEAS